MDTWFNTKQSLIDKVQRMLNFAGRAEPSEKFQALPSYIPTQGGARRLDSIIIIDIGGTATKVAVRRGLHSPTWQVLMEDPNELFDDDLLQGNSFERFAAVVARKTVGYLKDQGYHVDTWALGIVWSNAMQNTFIKDFGVDGRVVNRDRYPKGEWFNRDTKDGDSVGLVFSHAFKQEGITISLCLVGNDTPLTMKAQPSAHAGMVVSTGVNATLVKNEINGTVICNGEMGTSLTSSGLTVPEDFIDPGVRPSIIEHLISGRNLPRLFISHIMANNVFRDELAGLPAALRERGPDAYNMFSTLDMAACLDRAPQFKEKLEALITVDDQMLNALYSICSYLVVRAARLSSILAYAAIWTQIEERDDFIIAVDSSLCRGIPLFHRTLVESLNDITPPGKTITLDLIDRIEVSGGILSVPMLGAANALDALASCKV